MLENSRRGTTGIRSKRLWSGLIVAEIALTSVLLVGAGLFARSLLLLQSVNPGFRPEKTMAIGLDMTASNSGAARRPQALFAGLLDRVRILSGVISAGVQVFSPCKAAAGRTGRVVDGAIRDSSSRINSGHTINSK
jgi:hypothetical protein